MTMQKQETNVKKIDDARMGLTKSESVEVKGEVKEQPTATASSQAQQLAETLEQVDSSLTASIQKHPLIYMGLAVAIGYVSYSLIKKLSDKS